jgi:multidrug efflux pump subunit AcrB
LEGDAQIVAMSWLLSTLAMSPSILAFLAYWRGLHTAARLLPKERLKHGDYRVVPDLYSPGSSHRWFGIIVGEKTNSYSKRLKGALTLARVAVVLLPFALLGSVALLGKVRIEPTDDAGSSMSVVTIPLER